MKVLIVSDTHGRHTNLERVLELVRPIDLMIHLGDALGQEDYIESIAECPLEIVAGNNDFYSRLDQEKVIQIGPYKAFLTHGHYYYVQSSLRDVKRAGKEKGADFVMYGHTHIPVIDESDGIITLNPGSISLPRQEGKKPSYMILELNKKGKFHIFLEFLNGL